MINPVVERRFADCTELVDSWRAYLDQFNMFVKNVETELSPEVEQRFMECKARIAMLHDSFMESLRHDQNIGQNMLSIVNRSITLRHLRKVGDADRKKIEIEWHEAYLLLNETVSQLAEERERLANINEFTYKLGKFKETILVNVKAFVRSIWFKIGVALLIVLALVFGVPPIQKLTTINYIGKPYRSFLDMRRDYLMVPGPYSSIGKFVDHYMGGGKMPAGFSTEQGFGTKEGSAQYFQSMRFYVENTDASTMLNTASEYRNLSLHDSTGQTFQIHLFLYADKWNDARLFAKGYTDATFDPTNDIAQASRDTITVFADNNVLVVIGDNSSDARSQVKREIFGQ